MVGQGHVHVFRLIPIFQQNHQVSHLVASNQRINELHAVSRVENVGVHPPAHEELDASHDLHAHEGDGQPGRVDVRGGPCAVEPHQTAAVLWGKEGP